MGGCIKGISFDFNIPFLSFKILLWNLKIIPGELKVTQHRGLVNLVLTVSISNYYFQPSLNGA